MDELINLAKRANINLKRTDVSDVIIYEDHRTIINVLYFLKSKEQLEFPIDIFMFDDHDDAVEPSESALNKIREYNANPPGIEEFWKFTEFELRGLDDDWVKAGMQLGLINNVFLFNSSQSSIYFSEDYETINHGVKKIYNIGNVWDALGHRGCLEDVIKRTEYGNLWDDLGWEYNRDTSKFEFNPQKKYIVDIDLDCFTTEIFSKVYAIPENILIDKFRESHRSSNHNYYNSELFVSNLIRESKFTTMCFENQFCGGIRESIKIFNTIDFLFFANQIGD